MTDKVEHLVLSDVLDALTRQHTVAVICTHLKEYVATAFRGDEARGPTKLLRTPDGAARRANVDDVLVIEAMLASIVDDARREFAHLQSARVLPNGVRGPQKEDRDEAPEAAAEVVEDGRVAIKRAASRPGSAM